MEEEAAGEPEGLALEAWLAEALGLVEKEDEEVRLPDRVLEGEEEAAGEPEELTLRV